MKTTMHVCFTMIAIVLAGLYVSNAQDGSAEPIGYDEPNDGRVVWQQGYQAERLVLHILPGQEISVGTASVVPAGMELFLAEGGVWARWEPEQAGLHLARIQVTAFNPPPFENWTGQLMVNTRVAAVLIAVVAPSAADFIDGGHDILVFPPVSMP